MKLHRSFIGTSSFFHRGLHHHNYEFLDTLTETMRRACISNSFCIGPLRLGHFAALKKRRTYMKRPTCVATRHAEPRRSIHANRTTKRLYTRVNRSNNNNSTPRLYISSSSYYNSKVLPSTTARTSTHAAYAPMVSPLRAPIVSASGVHCRLRHRHSRRPAF